MKLSSFALWAVGTLASLAILETVSAAPMDGTGQDTVPAHQSDGPQTNSVPRWKEPGSGALKYPSRFGHSIRQIGDGKVYDSKLITVPARGATRAWDLGASGVKGVWNGGARVARGAGSVATWPFRKFRNTFGTKGWYNTMATPGRVIGEKVKPLYKNPTVDRVRGWGTAARKTVFGTKATPNPEWTRRTAPVVQGAPLQHEVNA